MDSLWYRYQIILIPKKGRKDADRDKQWEDIPDAHPAKIERIQKNVVEKGSSELTREILLKLSQNVSSLFDGAILVVNEELLWCWSFLDTLTQHLAYFFCCRLIQNKLVFPRPLFGTSKNRQPKVFS